MDVWASEMLNVMTERLPTCLELTALCVCVSFIFSFIWIIKDGCSILELILANTVLHFYVWCREQRNGIVAETRLHDLTCSLPSLFQNQNLFIFFSTWQAAQNGYNWLITHYPHNTSTHPTERVFKHLACTPFTPQFLILTTHNPSKSHARSREPQPNIQRSAHQFIWWSMVCIIILAWRSIGSFSYVSYPCHCYGMK